MLISSGRVSTLGMKPWVGVEVVSETQIEENVLHLLEWGKKNLKTFQLLFPVASRDLPSIKLLSPYLFMRAPKLDEMKKVSSLYGISGLVVDPDNKVVAFPNDFVQDVIQRARATADEWSKGVKPGSFVRVVYGSLHMLCGEVKRVRDGIAEVDISLRLRRVKAFIPVRALLSLPDDAEREYFYSGVSK